VLSSKIAEAASEARRRLLLSKALTPLSLLSLGVRTICGLLSRPTLRLLYHFLLGEPQDRRRAAKEFRRVAVNLVKTHLPRVLAARPGRVARKADQQWQNRLQAADLAGRTLAREQVTPFHRPTRWDQTFALPDPWAYNSDYEVVKRAQTLSLLPEEPFAEALEVGCAEGHFTVGLAAKVQRLTSIDISSRALKRAGDRCAALQNVAFQRLDLDSRDFRPDRL
jgi:tRNA/tmRNA/rRNA uracil-C5-methylase (TrmA/RlmC/RlmD family)